MSFYWRFVSWLSTIDIANRKQINRNGIIWLFRVLDVGSLLLLLCLLNVIFLLRLHYCLRQIVINSRKKTFPNRRPNRFAQDLVFKPPFAIKSYNYLIHCRIESMPLYVTHQSVNSPKILLKKSWKKKSWIMHD